MAADLHVHTTASDGSLSPQQVIAKASALGLRTIAITDHDTVLGVARALRAGRVFGVEVIPGIELGAEMEEEEIHILGYYIRYQDDLLRRTLANLREARFTRIRKMTHLVNQLGLKVSWKRVLEIAGKGVVGRPHLARALLDQGYVSSIREAFERYLGRDCPAYVPRPKLTPAEAIRLIWLARGIPVLAHPGDMATEMVEKLAALGLLGLEVYYPLHNTSTTRRLYRLAKRYNLLITGGSDFHAQDQEGTELGSATVPHEYVVRLREAISGPSRAMLAPPFGSNTPFSCLKFTDKH